MSGIVAGALTAHPPILLPEVGGAESQRVQATAHAMQELDAILMAAPATLAIVISPHSPSSMTSLPVRRATRVGGDLARFRAPQVRVEADVDLDLASKLVADGQRAGFALTWAEDSELDHGVVVPLHLLPRTMKSKHCVFLGVSGWPLQRFLAFGGWLQQWLQHRGAILIASGDLSHRLTPDAPYGFRPEGPVFDRLVIGVLTNPAKLPLFTADERVALVQACVTDLAGVVAVEAFEGLTVEFAHRQGAGFVVRGLRAVSDRTTR